MTTNYTVAAAIPPDAVTDALELAAVALECLHTPTSAPRLPCQFDPKQRVLTLPTGSKNATDFAHLVLGFLTRSFGPEACEWLAPPEPVFHDDDGDFRTLFDWAEQLSLDTDEVRDLLRENPGVHLDDPLTAAQMNDLIGLTMMAQRSTRE